MCGAEKSTAIVAMMVKSVNKIKQMRSTTIAANFQSLLTSWFSSSCRILSVMTRNSLRIPDNSRCEPKQLCKDNVSSWPDYEINNPLTNYYNKELNNWWNTLILRQTATARSGHNSRETRRNSHTQRHSTTHGTESAAVLPEVIVDV